MNNWFYFSFYFGIMNIYDKPFTFDRVIRIVITLFIILGLLYFVHVVRAALLPFVVAWLIAYLLNPLVQFVRNKLRVKNKVLAIFIVLITITAIITGAVFALLPSIKEESRSLIEAAKRFFENRDFIPVLPHALQEYIVENFNIKEFFSGLSAQGVKEILGGTFRFVGGVFSGSYAIIVALLAFFITLIYIVFILIDYERISKGAIGLIPLRFRDKAASVLADVEYAMNRYFRGQAMVAGSVGILLAIGFKIIGLPMGVILGLFIGLLNMVPYLQIVGIVPMVFLCLLQALETGNNFWVVLALAVGVLIIVQLIQDLFLVPKIMGKMTGLNPAIILLSLSIWGILLGVLGMIIALPMTTLLLSYYERFIATMGKKEDNDDLKPVL